MNTKHTEFQVKAMKEYRNPDGRFKSGHPGFKITRYSPAELKIQKSIWNKRYRDENRDIINQRVREYRRENKDIINLKRREKYHLLKELKEQALLRHTETPAVEKKASQFVSNN